MQVHFPNQGPTTQEQIDKQNSMMKSILDERFSSIIDERIRRTIAEYESIGYSNVTMHEVNGERYLTANLPLPDPTTSRSHRSRSHVFPSQDNRVGELVTIPLESQFLLNRPVSLTQSRSDPPPTPIHSRITSPSDSQTQQTWTSSTNVQQGILALYQPGAHDQEASTSYLPRTHSHDSPSSHHSHGEIIPYHQPSSAHSDQGYQPPHSTSHAFSASFRPSGSISPYLSPTQIQSQMTASPSIAQASTSNQSPYQPNFPVVPAQDPLAATHSSHQPSGRRRTSRLISLFRQRSQQNEQSKYDCVYFS